MIDPILFWNDVAMETHRRDFTVAGGGDSFAPGDLTPEVGGPTRVSRAFAMVHVAMYEAYRRADPNAGLKAYGPLKDTKIDLGLPPVPIDFQVFAAGAVSGAAVAVLKGLWPRQTAWINGRLGAFPGGNPDRDFQAGADFGHAMGRAVLGLRADDGSDARDDMTFSHQTGRHRPDPFSPGQGRLSTLWGALPPFCIEPGKPNKPIHDRYIAPFPPLGTPRYLESVRDVKDLGQAAGGTRSPDQTMAGIYWGYDGPRGLGVPPRLYNQVVRAFVARYGSGNTVADNARLFALVHAGMADAAIVAWSAKYAFDLWRPVVGIREHDAGYGPGHGAAKAAPGALLPESSVYQDAGWAPLGRPATNTPGQLFRTPDFPAYPSGHATFGAVSLRLTALFFAEKLNRPVAQVMNDLPIAFVSDEFNGVNVDPRGDIRPLANRELSLRGAIIENALSRVYLGVHWRFDGLGAVAPDDLDGPVPTDPSAPVKLADAVEKKLGGVPVGLQIARELFKDCFKPQ